MKRSVGFSLALFGAAIAVFLLDAFAPRGMAVGVLYVPLVLAAGSRPPHLAIALAAVCSVFTVLDVFLSPLGAGPATVLVNRSTILAAVWLSAAMAAGRKIAKKREASPTLQAVAQASLRRRKPRPRPIRQEIDTAEGFLGSLVKHGLLPPDESAERPDLAKVLWHDPQELAEELVQRGKLTEYQAAWALKGRAGELEFGHYIVLDSLGEGGMGKVYKARHRHLDRVVALKVLTDRAASPQATKRFRQEVRAVAKLKHPNIVAAHDAGDRQNRPFLVMEYVEGSNLAELIKSYGPLPIGDAVAICLQAARGLQYAHKRGVIHLDIKPSNLIIDDHLHVVILDLGLARLASFLEHADESGARTIIGTVDFMSPEQIFDPTGVDHRADIYSLGCTLYYMLTGGGPFAGCSERETLLAHRNQAVRPIGALRTDVPAELDRTFERMVAKRPCDRYPTMDALVQDLEACQGAIAQAGGGGQGVQAPLNAVERSCITKRSDSTARLEDAEQPRYVDGLPPF